MNLVIQREETEVRIGILCSWQEAVNSKAIFFDQTITPKPQVLFSLAGGYFQSEHPQSLVRATFSDDGYQIRRRKVLES